MGKNATERTKKTNTMWAHDQLVRFSNAAVSTLLEGRF
jgi:hypothetical protein